jgi:hypothetical protein
MSNSIELLRAVSKQAIRPLRSVIWNRKSNGCQHVAVNKWLKLCPPDGASVFILFQDAAEIDCWLWRFSRWKLKGIYYYFPIVKFVIECKMLMWKFTCDLARRNQFTKSFNSDLEVPVHFRNGVPRVSRCLVLRRTPHPMQQQKVIILITCLTKVLQI